MGSPLPRPHWLHAAVRRPPELLRSEHPPGRNRPPRSLPWCSNIAFFGSRSLPWLCVYTLALLRRDVGWPFGSAVAALSGWRAEQRTGVPSWSARRGGRRHRHSCALGQLGSSGTLLRWVFGSLFGVHHLHCRGVAMEWLGFKVLHSQHIAGRASRRTAPRRSAPRCWTVSRSWRPVQRWMLSASLAARVPGAVRAPAAHQGDAGRLTLLVCWPAAEEKLQPEAAAARASRKLHGGARGGPAHAGEEPGLAVAQAP